MLTFLALRYNHPNFDESVSEIRGLAKCCRERRVATKKRVNQKTRNIELESQQRPRLGRCEFAKSEELPVDMF